MSWTDEERRRQGEDPAGNDNGCIMLVIVAIAFLIAHATTDQAFTGLLVWAAATAILTAVVLGLAWVFGRRS